MLKSHLIIGSLALLSIGQMGTVEAVGLQPSEHNVVEYTVKPGDNLYRISLNHQSELKEVLTLNNFAADETIHPGDRVVLPIEKEEEKEEISAKAGIYGQQLEDWQYNTLLAVVQQEAGYNYESALAVMSVITNRVDAGAYGGDTVWEVITAKSQFEAYGAGHYQKHLGNIDPQIERAVSEALSGKKTVSYLNFWEANYAAKKGQSGQNIGGNVYFNY